MSMEWLAAARLRLWFLHKFTSAPALKVNYTAGCCRLNACSHILEHCVLLMQGLTHCWDQRCGPQER